MTTLDDRFHEVELDAQRDRDHVSAIANGLTAITNWQAAHGRDYQEFKRQVLAELATARADRAADRKALLRLTAFPVGGIAHLVFGQAGGDITSPKAFGPALVVLVLVLLFPELRSALVARASAAPSSSAPPRSKVNGVHPHSDPPAPGH